MRLVACFAAIIALAIGLLAWAGYRIKPHLTIEIPDANQQVIRASAILTWLPFREYPQLSRSKMSVNDATKLYVANSKRDHSYDWKVRLAFYGKVVDENRQPIDAATIRLEWNTNNVPGGTEAKIESSDARGLFSLTGEHGKILGVLVQKAGYYTSDRGAERSFEYANPSSPNWYEPDAAQPVVFQIRKKGSGAELFSKHLTIPVHESAYSKNEIDLLGGFIRSGPLSIETNTSKFVPGAEPFPWSVKITMTEGGLVETDDRFPFLAPETGYSPSAVFEFFDLNRDHWQAGLTKTFYFYLPNSNIYGRVRINCSTSLPVELDEVYNRQPGNRYLEPREGSWRDNSSGEHF